MCLLPEELTLEGRDPPPRHPGSLYAISLKSIYPFVIAAAPLEIAMAAFDAFLTLACHKTPGSGSVVRRDKPIVRAMIGRLSALLQSAQEFTMSWPVASRNEFETNLPSAIDQRAQVRIAVAHIGEVGKHVGRNLYDAADGSSAYETCPLEWHFRDVNSAVQHVQVSSDNFEFAGRVILGLDAGTGRLKQVRRGAR
jgi:hypothetical protein